jgi:hypothetical protein
MNFNVYEYQALSMKWPGSSPHKWVLVTPDEETARIEGTHLAQQYDLAQFGGTARYVFHSLTILYRSVPIYSDKAHPTIEEPAEREIEELLST